MDDPFLLFDLDDTLYPASAGVLREIDRRINDFTSRYLDVPPEEAHQLRRGQNLRYGTTLHWLRVKYGFHDTDAYLREIHPRDVTSFVSPDPRLEAMLRSLPNRRALLTNSPGEHAGRILDALHIRHLFPRIWDLQRLGFRGKPHREAYHRVLGDLGLTPSETVLVEDNRTNLDAFIALGGRGVLVDESDPGNTAGEAYPVIRRIHDLPVCLAA